MNRYEKYEDFDDTDSISSDITEENNDDGSKTLLGADMTQEEVANFWKTVDINIEDLNDLPVYPGVPKLDIKKVPDFFKSVIFRPNVKSETIEKFIRKFYLYYHFCPIIRERVQDYNLLILNQQYVGIFKNDDECVKFARKQKGKPTPHIVPIVPEVLHEFIEISTSFGKYVQETNENGLKYNYIQYESYNINCNFKLENINRKLTYIIDSACTMTHLPIDDIWDYMEEKFIFREIQKHILKIKEMKVMNAGRCANIKILIIFDDELKFKVDNILISKCNTFSVSKKIEKISNTQSSISSFKDLVMNGMFGSTNDIEYVIPQEGPKLLGLNVLNQLQQNTYQLSKYVNMMELKSNNINYRINKLSSNNSKNVKFDKNGLQIKYEVININKNIPLYRIKNHRGSNSISPSKNENIYDFYVNKNISLLNYNKSISIEQNYLTEDIKLFLVHKYKNISLLDLKIKNDINGYIFMDKEPPYNLILRIDGEYIDDNTLDNILLYEEEITEEDYIQTKLIEEEEIILDYKIMDIDMI